MARKKQIALRKQELISQMAESRDAIDRGRSAIKEKLNVKKQVTSLVRRKPKAVFAGSAVVGLIATLMLRRPRKSRDKKGKTLSKMITGWAFLLIKPAAKKWLTKSLKTYAIGKLKGISKRQQPQLVDAEHETAEHIR